MRVNFLIIPLTLTAAGYNGWALEIRLYGFGDSTEGARAAWARGFVRVKEFLLEVERQNRRLP